MSGQKRWSRWGLELRPPHPCTQRPRSVHDWWDGGSQLWLRRLEPPREAPWASLPKPLAPPPPPRPQTRPPVLPRGSVGGKPGCPRPEAATGHLCGPCSGRRSINLAGGRGQCEEPGPLAPAAPSGLRLGSDGGGGISPSLPRTRLAALGPQPPVLQGHHGGQAKSGELFSGISLLSGRASGFKVALPAGLTESLGGPEGRPLAKRAWGLPPEAPLPTPVLCPVCAFLSPSSRGAAQQAWGPHPALTSRWMCRAPSPSGGTWGCRPPLRPSLHLLTPCLFQGVTEGAPFSGCTGPGGALLMSSRHWNPRTGRSAL